MEAFVTKHPRGSGFLLIPKSERMMKFMKKKMKIVCQHQRIPGKSSQKICSFQSQNCGQAPLFATHEKRQNSYSKTLPASARKNVEERERFSRSTFRKIYVVFWAACLN